MGRFPGEGNGYPVQYSCLENLMARGAWGLDTTERLTRSWVPQLCHSPTVELEASDVMWQQPFPDDGASVLTRAV